ncbi:MAG: DUF2065 domain-containing protein [Clostridiales bacterium]|nr:DUF2065 domain-containing protein [Clostridiales bacterium]
MQFDLYGVFMDYGCAFGVHLVCVIGGVLYFVNGGAWRHYIRRLAQRTPQRRGTVATERDSKG